MNLCRGPGRATWGEYRGERLGANRGQHPMGKRVEIMDSEIICQPQRDVAKIDKRK